MPPFLPVRAISRSQAVRIGGKPVKQDVTTYVDLDPATANTPRAYPAVKELRNHLAIGAVIVVGPLTNTTEDWVVYEGAVITTVNAAESTVATTEAQLLQRSTGKYVVVKALTTKKAKETAASKERIDIVQVEDKAGATPELVEGVEAAEGKAVQPATTANFTLLVVLKSKNKEAKFFEVIDARPKP